VKWEGDGGRDYRRIQLIDNMLMPTIKKKKRYRDQGNKLGNEHENDFTTVLARTDREGKKLGK